MTKVNITSPVGRVVGGNFYKPNTTDAEGRPLVYKHGLDAGKPRVDYFFALAIPKQGEQHWNQTAWGAEIYKVGQIGFPQGQFQAPDFAWKITDGDSPIPNKKGVIPNKREGYPGHWVLKFSGGYAPRLFNSTGTEQLLEPDYVKPGYYVQVNFDVDGNESMSQPGIYLNHKMVAFAAYGKEIISGPDPRSVGFGTNAALPAGASAAPVGGTFNPAAPVAAPVQQYPQAPVAAPVQQYQPAPVAPVQPASPLPPPNPAILHVPAPSVPVAAPVAPVRQMTPAAGGHTYESLIGAGWTDAQLIQQGLMVA
jgi:hypothetical protein